MIPVLCVEREPAVAAVVEDALQRLGCEVRLVASVVELAHLGLNLLLLIGEALRGLDRVVDAALRAALGLATADMPVGEAALERAVVTHPRLSPLPRSLAYVLPGRHTIGSRHLGHGRG